MPEKISLFRAKSRAWSRRLAASSRLWYGADPVVYVRESYVAADTDW